MTATELGEMIFAHANLSTACQRLVTGVFPEYADALAASPHPLAPGLWRQLYTPTAPADRVRSLIARADTTPADIAWMVTERTERRTGPLQALSSYWLLPLELQATLAGKFTASTVKEIIGSGQVHPALQVQAAVRVGHPSWAMEAVRVAPHGTVEDDLVLAAFEAYAAATPQSTADTRRVKDLAKVLQDRPALRPWAAAQDHVEVAAAAAQLALEPEDSARVARTLLGHLGAQDDVIREAAEYGLAALMWRFDTPSPVRQEVRAHLEAGDLTRFDSLGVQVRRDVGPMAGSVDDLSAGDIDVLLVLAGQPYSLYAGTAVCMDLASSPNLAEDQAWMVYSLVSHKSTRWTPVVQTLAARSSRVADDVNGPYSSSERRIGEWLDRWARAAQVSEPVRLADPPRPPRLTGTDCADIPVPDIIGSPTLDVAVWLGDRVGGNPDHLTTLLGLAPEFTGTCGELIETVHAIV